MSSTFFPINIAPQQRKERRVHRQSVQFKEHNAMQHNKTKKWIRCHFKQIKPEIPEDQLAIYRKMFLAIDTSNDGALQFEEIVDAFKFSGYKITERQLRKDLGITALCIDSIDFETFCDWFYAHIKGEQELFETLEKSIARFDRENRFQEIQCELELHQKCGLTQYAQPWIPGLHCNVAADVEKQQPAN